MKSSFNEIIIYRVTLRHVDDLFYVVASAYGLSYMYSGHKYEQYPYARDFNKNDFDYNILKSFDFKNYKSNLQELRKIINFIKANESKLSEKFKSKLTPIFVKDYPEFLSYNPPNKEEKEKDKIKFQRTSTVIPKNPVEVPIVVQDSKKEETIQNKYFPDPVALNIIGFQQSQLPLKKDSNDNGFHRTSEEVIDLSNDCVGKSKEPKNVEIIRPICLRVRRRKKLVHRVIKKEVVREFEPKTDGCLLEIMDTVKALIPQLIEWARHLIEYKADCFRKKLEEEEEQRKIKILEAEKAEEELKLKKRLEEQSKEDSDKLSSSTKVSEGENALVPLVLRYRNNDNKIMDRFPAFTMIRPDIVPAGPGDNIHITAKYLMFTCVTFRKTYIKVFRCFEYYMQRKANVTYPFDVMASIMNEDSLTGAFIQSKCADMMLFYGTDGILREKRLKDSKQKNVKGKDKEEKPGFDVWVVREKPSLSEDVNTRYQLIEETLEFQTRV